MKSVKQMIVVLGLDEKSKPHVRLHVGQRDVDKSDFTTCFTKRGEDVQLQARALVSHTEDGGLDIVLSMSDFQAARVFLLEQWDVDGRYEDDDVDDDEDDDNCDDEEGDDE